MASPASGVERRVAVSVDRREVASAFEAAFEEQSCTRHRPFVCTVVQGARAIGIAQIRIGPKFEQTLDGCLFTRSGRCHECGASAGLRCVHSMYAAGVDGETLLQVWWSAFSDRL